MQIHIQTLLHINRIQLYELIKTSKTTEINLGFAKLTFNLRIQNFRKYIIMLMNGTYIVTIVFIIFN